MVLMAFNVGLWAGFDGRCNQSGLDESRACMQWSRHVSLSREYDFIGSQHDVASYEYSMDL